MPDYKKDLLQQIADDERRPMNEREAARRELAGPVTQSPPSPCHGRNANVPSSAPRTAHAVQKRLRALMRNRT
jgi:hypothetical protein